MYKIIFSKQFLKDIKTIKSHKSFKESELLKVLQILINGDRLPEKYRNHKLKGNLSGKYDLHLAFDIVVIYEIEEEFLLVHMIRVGSHAALNLN